ncbi:MAG: hypothetical protein GF330_11770 [Candidatus Eisenbacteria bacterium]|nr:hypothetical protein [Candidatus Eisenbacteria bacterium]
MQRMVLALIPLALSAVYFFGWRTLSVLAVVFAAGIFTEYLTSRQRGQPVSTACLVTCALYGLSLPPTMPYWMAIVGIVVGILFGKEVFGGFGRNFANPAIVGRTFVYICFPVPVTSSFVPTFTGFPGGFAHWSFTQLERLPAHLADAGGGVVEAVSQATPLYVGKFLGPAVAERAFSLGDLFLGRISGLFEYEGAQRILSGGSMGEGSALLIILAAIFLLATKTANWRLMLSPFLGVVFATVLLRHLLGLNDWAPGAPDVPPLLHTLFGGATLYVIAFMVTDPVSAPKKRLAQYVYGFLIGFLIVFLRWRGVFVAAASFALLLGNLLGPLLDLGANWWQQRRKAAAQSGAE